jgi:uncharacterized protein (DUF2147 family)
MKSIQILITLLLLSITVTAQNKPNQIEGLWRIADMQTVIEIKNQNNGKWVGKVVKSNKPTAIGQIMLKDLYFDASKNKWKGSSFPPDRNITLDAELEIMPNGELKMAFSKFLMKKVTFLSRQ